MENTLFKCENISKTFGATKALTNVSIEVRFGEVLGLVGENGSGKSTLASIVAGNQAADTGTMKFLGKSHTPLSLSDAEKSGVSMIVQEQGTVNDITVAANLFLGKEEYFRKYALLNLGRMREEAQKALDNLGIKNIEPGDGINKYTLEERKLVELARAISTKPRLLIIDETTTALATGGRTLIKDVLQRMVKEGNSVLFISHDLDELLDVCGRITVLRDGIVVDTLAREGLTIPKLQALMVGREISGNYYRSDYKKETGGRIAIQVEHLSAGPLLADVSFDLRYGEILGVAGLSDCGIHDLGKAMFGLIKPITGSVKLAVKGIKIRSSKTAIRQHIAYIPKNRDTESLMQHASILENITVAAFDKLEKYFYLGKKIQRQYAEGVINKMSIKCRGVGQKVIELSGGNKQKVVFGKWTGNDSDIFILDCPTRGIDVGVKAAMYKLMEDLKKQGKAILLISEELQELIGMSDRILVFKDGRINSEFERRQNLSEHEIVAYMT
jgi:ribose transport system ATP-binding protein